METRFLETFRTAADLGSFTLAARRLGYSQSTVSAQIQALEVEAGTPLFDRSGRRLALTEEGRGMLDLAEEMLALQRRIPHLAGDPLEPQGDLSVAAAESITVARLGDVLGPFRHRHPRVLVRLRNATCSAMTDWVLHGEADLAFIILPTVRHPDLESLSLVEEELLFVGPPEAEEDLLLRALEEGRLEEGFIFTEQGCSYRTLAEHLFRRHGVVLEHTLELWSMEAIGQCVTSGLGIALMPRVYARGGIEAGRYRALKAPPLEEPFRTQVVWRRNRRLSPGAREFLRLTREAAEGWRAAGKLSTPPSTEGCTTPSPPGSGLPQGV